MWVFLLGIVHLLMPRLAQAANFTIEQWRVVEIPLVSSQVYTHPVEDVDVQAVFTKSGGPSITRRAFWNGSNSWLVRFAPPQTGTWTMTTISSDATNTGLHGQVHTVQASPYSGNLDIYRRGFLKISPDRRYFTYTDGTPFFYLGDTHWLINTENWSACNYPGCTSQFKFEVDKRRQQGFTVYQTEWLGVVSMCNITVSQIPKFLAVDDKFKYLTDAGLVVTVTVEWRTVAPNCTDTYLQALGRYWAARYGAYPVLWTVAQEVDSLYPFKDPPNLPAKWQVVGQALKENDYYNVPLTAHMVNESYVSWATSAWKNLAYHDWFGVQVQSGFNTTLAANYYTNAGKPVIFFEGPYENYWTDRNGNRNQSYAAFLSGWYGVGYGVAGVWDGIYDCTASTDPNCKPWTDGLFRESGNDMARLASFFKSISWWNLIPRFTNTAWGTFSDPNATRVATDGQNMYVVYFYGSGNTTGTLKNLSSSGTYSAQWFNPRTGNYVVINPGFTTAGQWTIPVRPTAEDYVLVVTKVEIRDANFLLWINHYGQMVSTGDFNTDGKVNSLDFGVWYLP